MKMIYTLILTTSLAYSLHAEENCVPEYVTINGVTKKRIYYGNPNEEHPSGYKYVFTFDENGKTVLQDYYDLGTGEIFQEGKFYYEEDGRNYRIEYYNNTSGVFKKVQENRYTYDLEDNPDGYDRIYEQYNCNDTQCKRVVVKGYKGGTATSVSCSLSNYCSEIKSFASVNNFCFLGCSSCSEGKCLEYRSNAFLDDGSIAFYKNSNLIAFKNKRIYTIEEANEVAKPTGNTIRIKYR